MQHQECFALCAAALERPVAQALHPQGADGAVTLEGVGVTGTSAHALLPSGTVPFQLP